MAAAFVVAASVTSVGSVTSLTTGAFAVSGANTAAQIGLSTHAATTVTSASVSGGGAAAAIANADSGVQGSAPNEAKAVIWGQTAPAAGSQTATIAWTTSSTAVMGAVIAQDVDQSASFTNGTSAKGASTAPSVVITSAVNDFTMAVGAADMNTGLGSASAPTQTSRWNGHDNGFVTLGFGSTGAGAATVTHAWTLDLSVNWAMAGANFAAAVSDPDIPSDFGRGFHPGAGPTWARFWQTPKDTSLVGGAAADLEGAAALVLTAAGVLTTGIPLLGTASPLAISTAGVLTTAIPLLGSSVLALVTTGDLTTSIRLVGAADLVLSTASALVTAIQLAGSADLVISTTASLTTAAGASPTVEYVITFRRRRR